MTDSVGQKPVGQDSAGQDSADKESLIEFPAELAVKAMGLQTEDFESLVTTLVASQLPEGSAHKVTTQQSSGGKYVSVSVHFTASSLEQLKTIYASLRNESRVLYLL